MVETPSINVTPTEEPSVIPTEFRNAIVVIQFAPMVLSEEGVHVVEYEFPGMPPYRFQVFVAANPAPS
ncbi:MAG TPA: hypothetical protein VFL34_02940 [Candidatus Sulfotelmatobacter sp.]|nr:hypothetical protein [Candidatus Sulfotelmatobacter sp.]